jgi:aspartyl-tRNA(Asn)/glutamyl-tRNA(Gln) amidotransferase subunit A
MTEFAFSSVGIDPHHGTPGTPGNPTAAALDPQVRNPRRLDFGRRKVSLSNRPLASLHFAAPTTLMLDVLDATVSHAFDRAITCLEDSGAEIETITLPSLKRVPPTLSPPEARAWRRRLLVTREAEYDPRIAAPVRLGESMTAADCIDRLRARHDFITDD